MVKDMQHFDESMATVPTKTTQEEEQEKKRLTIFYKRVDFEGVERFWCYFRRLGRVVNFEASSIPYIIRRLVYFYIISGYSLDVAEDSLKEGLNQVTRAKEELKMCEQA